MRTSRLAALIAALATASCAAILGIQDTTDEAGPEAAPPRIDATVGDEDPNADAEVPLEETDASLVIEEPPVIEDAGTYADVSSIDAQVPTCAETGLVARWKLEEGSGTVVSDCSGNNLHGVVTNGAWTSNGAGASALLFNGNGWVGFANPPLLKITGALTLSLWIRADKSTTGTEYLLGKTTSSGANGYRLALIDASRQLAFATPSSATFFNVVGGSVPLDKWRHVAAVYQPSTRAEVYLGGTRVGVRTSSVPAALVSSNAEARVAARFDGAIGFTGAVSDVRVYARALSASEIAALAVR